MDGVSKSGGMVTEKMTNDKIGGDVSDRADKGGTRKGCVYTKMPGTLANKGN